MNLRDTVVDALRRESGLLPRVTESLRARIGEARRIENIVHAAEAIEPIIADAVEKRPSRLGKLGLKSAQLIAGLAADDGRANDRLARLARNGTVGIAFVDVADFMALTAERGDEAASELLSMLQGIIDPRIRVVKGECVKRLGDGYLFAFPSASQAVRGAASIREGVRRRRVSDEKFDLSVRIAVHSGEPLREQADLIGFDVNLAARLLDHCDSDEIVVSEVAEQPAERRLRKISFENERLVKVQGLSAKIPIHSVTPA